ncbi:unnamed protein product [Rotaria magnacalcarata]|uniref:DDE-1 domain-containing protein n=1 Tax=Rotaria magnacalcarata TaxID=392030 RepID=A0A815DNS8_9BILA|nr:unnamed protein product [Rotaria magnacalcarata]
MSKKYTHQALVDAVASDMDSKAASIAFKVPASTIRQQHREPTLNIRAGRISYLNSDEESHFVSLMHLLPEYGFDATKNIVLQLAAEYFGSLEFTTQPGSKWLNSFVKRHFDDIIWKKQEKLERARAEAVTEQNPSGWFKTLKDVLIKHDLFDKPNQIFNADESGFSDKAKGQWVIVNSSCRHAFESNGGTGKDYRTAFICIAPGGQVLPPLLIYAGKRLIKLGVELATYLFQGWINTYMNEYWLENLFIPSTSHLNRPLLLIIDGHASHISLKMVNLLQANQIICLMFPSHSTHALQPLDVVVFNSVKHDWSKLFIEKAAFSPTRIVSSFAHAGVWPFDQNAMRHKIANNISIYPTPQSSSIHHAPTNILQPRLVCSTPSMSSNSTPISCSSTSSSYSPAVFANKSINTSTNIDQLPSSSSSLLNLFDPVSNSIHTTFQSFPLDLTLNIRS